MAKTIEHGCPRCRSENRRRVGSILSPRGRVQRWQCRDCAKKYHMSLKTQPIILRDGYLDIEAMGLKANFDPMIAWSILDRKTGKILHDLIPAWSLQSEKKIVASLIRAMRQFDRILTYNGALYDIPFIRTRALRHGLKPPEYMELYHHDLYFVARGRLSAHRKNLGTIAQVLGVQGKVDLNPRDWELAQFGNTPSGKAALRRILEHNKQDVRVLADVHTKLEPYYFGINKSI